MIDKIRKYIADNEIIAYGDSIVTGVSGGADSVCLLLVLAELRKEFGLRLMAVHINHGLRGAEADADEKYAVELCRSHDVECRVFKPDIHKLVQSTGMSEEEAGRKARYDIFNIVCNEEGYDKIAVAHHVNDNAETVLFNIFRGTGVRGACGMRPVNGNIIRPLLCITREHIEDFLRQRGIVWCTDRTNLEENYSRNKIRHKILKYAGENINLNAAQHTNDFACRLYEMYSYVQSVAEVKFKELLCEESAEDMTAEPKRIMLDMKKYLELDKVIADEVFALALRKLSASGKDIGAVHFDAVRAIARGASGKEIRLRGGLKVLNSGGKLIIYRHIINDIQSGEYMVCYLDAQSDVNMDSCIPGKKARLNIEVCAYNGEAFPKNPFEVWFDADRLEGELYMRTRQEGDMLIVNPDGRKKSIKSLFIDKKIPVCDRSSIYMLLCNDEILWIPGIRASEGRRINSNTKRVLKVHYIE